MTLCPLWWQNSSIGWCHREFWKLCEDHSFPLFLIWWKQVHHHPNTILPYNRELKTPVRLSGASFSRKLHHLILKEAKPTFGEPNLVPPLPNPSVPRSRTSFPRHLFPFPTETKQVAVSPLARGWQREQGRAIGNSLSPMSPGREVQGRSHFGARCSEAFPPVQSEIS